MSDQLTGIRVLDFTLAAVGPFCTRVMADLGAEVIHVEWPRMKWKALGDGRQATRFTREGFTHAKDQQLFAHANSGKKSLAVNLKTDEGIAIIRDLIAQSDVIVENMTPRVMRSFGLTYDVVKEINPRIVMCSMTGFGKDGLDGDTGRPCTDPVAQAMGGMSFVTGERDGVPYAVGGGIGDTATSMMGVTAVLAALLGRERTGRGVHIDLSMVESLAYLDCTALPGTAMSDGAFERYRNGQQNSYTFPMGPFRAAEGYLSLQASGVGADSPWGRLCGLMDRADLVDDPRLVDDQHRLEHTAEVIGIIEDWLVSLGDRDVALALLASERISSGPILSHRDMLDHPFFAGRGTFAPVSYPGIGDVTMVQPPFKFSTGPAVVKGPAPEMGENTREVLSELLDRSAEDVDRLMADDVVFESDGARVRNGAEPRVEATRA